jgi:hypothetical protein
VYLIAAAVCLRQVVQRGTAFVPRLRLWAVRGPGRHVAGGVHQLVEVDLSEGGDL